MLPLPSYDRQFITLFRFGSGYVRRHIAVDVKASDYTYLEAIAIEKAMTGMQVDIMPELIESDPMRLVIFYDMIGSRNPDLRIDGILWEVEGSTNSKNINNLKHAIDEGSRQSGCVIVNLSDEVTNEMMFRVAKGRFKDHKNLIAIEFRCDGKYTTFYK